MGAWLFSRPLAQWRNTIHLVVVSYA